MMRSKHGHELRRTYLHAVDLSGMDLTGHETGILAHMEAP